MDDKITYLHKTFMEFCMPDENSMFILCEELDKPPDRILIGEYATFEEAQQAVSKCGWGKPEMIGAVIIRAFGRGVEPWKHAYTASMNRAREILEIDAVHFDNNGNLLDGCPYVLEAIKALDC